MWSFVAQFLPEKKKDFRRLHREPDTVSAEVFAEGFKRSRSELRIHDSEEIARSNRALDSGLLDSVIQDIEGLPNSLRHESRADTERSEKELDEILKDLID